MRWLALALIGCAPQGEADPCAPSGDHLLVATTDYTVGVLAAVDPKAECVGDRLATLSPDPLVRTSGAQRFAVGRSAGDTVRSWTGTGWEEPGWEVGLEGLPNVHDVVSLGHGRLLVLPYDLPELWVLDASNGNLLQTVDLADEDPSDGLPEADSAVVVGDRVAVALQRFDRSDAWAAQPGRILWLSMDDLTVLDRLDTGPSPRILGLADGELAVLTGAYGALDGALHTVGADGALGDPWLVESDWDLDFGAMAAVGDTVVVVGTDVVTGESSVALCVERASGDVRASDPVTQWYADAVSGGDRVWVAARRTWSGRGQGAIVELDLQACQEAPRRYPSELEPYSLAWAASDSSVSR